MASSAVHQRARNRAMRRLAEIHPRQYRRLLDEERGILGLPPIGTSTRKDLDLDALRQAYSAGVSAEDLEARFGVSRVTLYRRLREAGIAIRSRGGNRA